MARRFCYALSWILVFIAAGCRGEPSRAWVGGMHSVADLAVLEVRLKKIVHGKKDSRWFFVPSASHIAESSCIARLGINLDDLQEEDLRVHGKSVSIDLPAVEVVDFRYQPSHFEVDPGLSRDAWLNRLTVADLDEFYRQSEGEIRALLSSSDLESRAQSRVSELMRLYLAAAGYEEIYISFREREQALGDF